MLNLVIKNSITFDRMPYYLCAGYNIKITYNNKTSETIYIENTPASNSVLEEKELEYNVDLTWKLPDNLIATNTNDIKVFINEIEIDTLYYNYNKASNLISIDNLDVTKNDIIKIQYECDKIIYEHNTHEKCKYEIFPVYRNNYKIGQHTKL